MISKLIDKNVIKLVSFIKQRCEEFEQANEAKIWQGRIDEALAAIPETQKANRQLTEALLKNYVNYARAYSASNSSPGARQTTLMLFKAVVGFAQKLSVLQKLVGVQPMTGPVGFIYQMRYKQQEQDQSKISLEIIKETIEAVTRKLQARWTLEAAQELKETHGLDMETELAAVLADEIFHEVAAEILTNVRRLAFKQTATLGKSPYVFENADTLMVNINAAMNEIARRTRRGCGNVIVASAPTISLMQMSKQVSFEPIEKGTPRGSWSLDHVGYLVYPSIGKDPLKIPVLLSMYLDEEQADGKTTHKILLGYKGGNGETDTGYFYCPFVPLMSSGVVMDPNTFQPVVSLMTRYATAQFSKGNSNDTVGESGDYYCELSYEYDFGVPSVNTNETESA